MAKIWNDRYTMHTEEMYFVVLCKCFSNKRKDFSTADGHTSGNPETFSEFPPAGENAVASVGASTIENANTIFNEPAGRNDMERCY
jgi:hypothetical protein